MLVLLLAAASLCILPALAFASGVTWTSHQVPVTGPDNTGWTAVTTSSDGTKLAAVSRVDIFTSTDGGVS